MENVVIIDEEHASRLRALQVLMICLFCSGFGYLFGQIRSAGQTSTEHIMAEKLQKAVIGDYVILKDGNVFRIGGSVEKAMIEKGHIYYNTRSTEAANQLYRPHWQMAALVVEVISPTNESYAIIGKCFDNGKIVTTAGPAKWTCT